MLVISLARFSESDHQDGCILFSTVGWFEIQTVLLSALNPRQPAVGQGGGVWDAVESDHSQSLPESSENSAESHALEDQHTN